MAISRRRQFHTVPQSTHNVATCCLVANNLQYKPSNFFNPHEAYTFVSRVPESVLWYLLRVLKLPLPCPATRLPFTTVCLDTHVQRQIMMFPLHLVPHLLLGFVQ